MTTKKTGCFLFLTRDHLVKVLLILIGLVCEYPTLYAQGQLWGTTRKGGITGGGTILKTNADASDYYEVKKTWVLNTAGTFPQETLLHASNGKIYGLTASGGATASGVLFETDPGSSFYRVLWNFTESYDGSNPQGGLVEAPNGKIYGFTSRGGQNYYGALFEFDPVTKMTRPKIHLTTPVASRLIIELPAGSDGYILQLLHPNGSVLQTLKATHEMAEWNVDGLSTGLYIVRVKHDEKTEYHKLMKR
jgi:hypothetical protein